MYRHLVTPLILAILLITSVFGCQQPQLTASTKQQINSSNITADTLITGLNAPWSFDFAPDGRVFITERPGQIRVVEGGKLLAEPWFTQNVSTGGERGLLGLALDPLFAQNGFIYIAYTHSTANGIGNRLVRLREDISIKKGVEDKIILDGMRGSSNHDGGRVKFGPDGKLYLTMGDSEMPDLAQDITSLNGKILRINSDGSIPDDNPFPSSPVYSYGHRNPQGLAWEPGTGRLYETEHGPSGIFKGIGQDEVNLIEAGKNYGWPLVSGNETKEGTVPPIIQSTQSETWAPTGATFVRGGIWDGSLIFTGLRGETLYRLLIDKNDPRKVSVFERNLTDKFGRLRDVVQGPDKQIYILTCNRDGRGQPTADDDRLIRLNIR